MDADNGVEVVPATVSSAVIGPFAVLVSLPSTPFGWPETAIVGTKNWVLGAMLKVSATVVGATFGGLVII